MRLHKFNPKKEEFKLKLKRNKNNIIKITSVICIAIIAIFMISYFTRSRFTTSATLEFEHVKVAPFSNGDFSIVAYIDGTKSSTIPEKDTGYVLDTSEGTNGVSCINNAIGVWNTEEWGLNIRNATQSGTRCDVYFKTKPLSTLYDTILTSEVASISAHGNTAPAFTGVSTTDEGMYKTTDDLGDVYYYRGAVQDNYVSFGGFCWRVVRTNGDHSVRLIYQGTTCDATGDDATIGKYAYNTSYNDNAYVGYMYGTAGSSTYAATHANTNSSNAKTQLESWYAANLSDYDSLIADQIFCNDRQPSTSSTTVNGSGGTGTTVTYYAPYIRTYETQQPVLTCTQAADKFSKTIANGGNGKLSQKVGMLTVDEVIMAGGFNAKNTSYYLYINTTCWLGSPCYMNPNGLIMFNLISGGYIGNGAYPNSIYGLRPVISLLPSVEVSSGNGSQSNPWVIDISNTNNNASDACEATTCTLSDCGSYSSCSATYTDETGTQTRTCTQTCTATSDSSIICSTDTNYQDSTSCIGTQSRSWILSRDCSSYGSDGCNFNNTCSNTCSDLGYSEWSCSTSMSFAPTSTSLTWGVWCWCAN